MKCKLWLVPLFIISSKIFAGTYDGPPAPSSHDVAGKIAEKMPRPITPNAGPRVDNGIDVFVTADFIYWTARMDNLGYVMTGLGDGITNAGKGSVHYPDWDWDPGFKAGVGLNLPHDGWDVYTEYTWLHSSASDSVTGLNHVPLWNIANLDATSVNNAHTKWDIHFNAIDLSLGRNYFISQFLTLRPFIGFKGSWINQDYHVNYDFADQIIVSQLRMRNDQDFWGIGLRFGLNTAWYVHRNWSFYGDLALTALWSQFDSVRNDIRNDSQNGGGTPLNTDITVLRTENEFHSLKALLEFGIGLRGEWWFMDDRYHFLIQAGWEEQVWINFNHLVVTQNDAANNGDLILQGLTIKVRFDF